MTQEEIIEMAKQAGIIAVHIEGDGHWHQQFIALETFAKLIAAKEREACAKVADQISDKYGWGYYGNEVDTADEIVDAIRSRGEA